MTQDTLWPAPNSADFVWLDGDHRLESIRKDFESLKNSKVVVLMIITHHKNTMVLA